MKRVLSVFILIMFFCGLSGQSRFIDTRDGNEYRTVSVNGKTWMAENLKYQPLQGAQLFDQNSHNLHCYGLLYDWKSAVQACPAGWHLPTGQEFQSLANHFDQQDAWKRNPADPRSFGIQLGGMQDTEGIFSEMDESAYYWTSTEYDQGNAEYFSYLMINRMEIIDISRKDDIAEIPGTEKTFKYSVRCVMN